jgi:tripeptidyl-peptidase-2
VYDANYKVVGHLDVYRHKIKLEAKGDYTIQLQLLTEVHGVLEKLKAAICELDFNASKTTTFNTYRRIADAFTSDKSTLASKLVLERNDQKALYIAAPTNNSSWLPSNAKPGDALVGTLSFESKSVDGGKYKALYVIPPSPAESKSSSSSGKKSDEVIGQELAESIKNLQIGALKKLDKKTTAYDTLLASLESEDPNNIALLNYKLDSVWTLNGANQTDVLTGKTEFSKAQKDDIIALSDKVLGQINENELLQFYMRPKPSTTESDAAQQVRKSNDKKKQQLVKALKHRLAALVASLPSADSDKETLDQQRQEIDKQADHLAIWTKDDDISSDVGSVLVQVKRERYAGRHGLALKAIKKYLDAAAVTSDTTKDLRTVWAVRADIYAKDLKWSLWADYDTKWNVIRAPPGGSAPL